MTISNITVLGGDLRQAYAAQYLSSCGFCVTCFQTLPFPYSSSIRIADSPAAALENNPALLLPCPLSPEVLEQLPFDELIKLLSEGSVIFHNGIPDSLRSRLSRRNCILCSLSDSPGFSAENAELTAEGLLSELIRYTPFCLKDTLTLLLGYGRCGSAVGNLLSHLGTRIYVLEQDTQKQRLAEENGLSLLSDSERTALLPHCDLIINTVPDTVLTNKDLKLLPGNCHIFDIASAPFGFTSKVTATYLLPYFRLPGLPGKFSPKTAGIVIGKAIEWRIRHDL